MREWHSILQALQCEDDQSQGQIQNTYQRPIASDQPGEIQEGAEVTANHHRVHGVRPGPGLARCTRQDAFMHMLPPQDLSGQLLLSMILAEEPRSLEFSDRLIYLHAWMHQFMLPNLFFFFFFFFFGNLVGFIT